MKQNEANALMLKQTEANEGVSVNVNDIYYSFDEFWNDYDKKVDTKKCKDKFEKLNEDDRIKIKTQLMIT